MPALTSSGATLTIELPGYLPSLHNQIRGCHWTVLRKEKMRAAVALRNALRSLSESSPSAPAIGTTLSPSLSKTCLLKLDSSPAMLGINFTAASSLKRYIVKRKKKR